MNGPVFRTETYQISSIANIDFDRVEGKGSYVVTLRAKELGVSHRTPNLYFTVEYDQRSPRGAYEVGDEFVGHFQPLYNWGEND